MSKFVSKNIIGILIAIIIVLILIITSIIFRRANNINAQLDSDIDSEENNPIVSYPISYEQNNQDKSNTADNAYWEEYFYTFTKLSPHFSIKYPSGWSKELCEASGCWDINLSKGNDLIRIDFTGLSTNIQTQEIFESSLENFITNFGSLDKKYIFEIIEQANIINDQTKYVTFKVTEESEASYLISIVDIAEMNNGRAHLAIKVDVDNSKILKDILNSIRFI